MKKKNSKNRIVFEDEVNFPLLSKIAYDIWPKDKFNKLESIDDCKSFYNSAYKKIFEELNKILDSYHAAAWVREAFIQLEKWTFVFYNYDNDGPVEKLKEREILAPPGRYGWRYIIEISLEKINNPLIKQSTRPDRKTINTVFTLLLALSYSSEYSNYLHYFKSKLSSATVKLSPYVFTQGLRFNEEESLFYRDVINYMLKKPDWSKYKSFAVENDPVLMEMINNMLEKFFGFNLKHVQTFADVYEKNIIPEIVASILITTYENAVSIFSKYSELPSIVITSILNFILLDAQSPTYKKRDFLSRSQQERMLNYVGTIVHLEDCFETIYDPVSAKFSFVTNSKKHIILAGNLFVEWFEIFISRLVYGQRQDLKNIDASINQEISIIEEYYHKKIFETKLKQLITDKGYYCISVDRVNGETIACGEIDIIAYNPIKNHLLVIEAKCHAPAKDARSMGKIISDHFKQKKYHQKFMLKMNWVDVNIDLIGKIFKKQFNVQFNLPPKIESYFITGSSNAVKFLVKEYEVFTFYEFDKVLNEKR